MPHPPPPKGLSLLELLVTLGVIAVLIAITAPALLSVKRSSAVLMMTSNQRDSAVEIHSYASDNAFAFPFWSTPGGNRAPLRWETTTLDLSYWAQPMYWPAFLHTRGYNGAIATYSSSSDNHNPSAESLWRMGSGQTAHLLSYTVFADPRYWSDRESQTREYHRGMRFSDIRTPSRKGILTHLHYHGLRRSEDEEVGEHRVAWIITFADLHTRAMQFADLREGFGSPYIWRAPVLTTEHGVLGDDLR